ncbi:hypothetical protein [Clostridium beijerinckii]|uniref:Uncharacterized protein n=1 Tax=Clostridium beijerinckii TaxID=1520 RepID=A0A0B5QQX2_CLOBE|nr:hypothetical protein [Clostridium beijerinckii]AJG99278.1 hypothetical protein LF65_02705 [Clostridium beijerinckii]AQS05499.1 hypothetical protein CLBIJ_29320 [Clostridium beijerinckii]MBA2884998.1 hypothetical protein [Clostridium beijerinckii]MBA2899628.1 hypothetical protein [Clostridium beijerinckii]MBA2909349.1 hypothetical protein [Clostridium beijerinckii]
MSNSFPESYVSSIVYSCKLRSSENGNSQILTDEREIKKAFLKDADSEKLERLGQVNQIMMFES